MKIIIIPLLILLSVTTIACTKSYVKPDISCPDPVLRQVSITDDKSVLEALNLITEAYLAEKLQVDCYKRTLK